MSLIKNLITIFGLVICVESSAKAKDFNDPIIIESDSAERNEKTGLTQYKGNVVIQQGSMVIDANEVTVFYESEDVSHIRCEGKPASFQQSDQSGDRVLARAETIEYDPSTELVNLKTNASLSHNGTQIKGDSINYDIRNESWKAKGDNQSTQKRIQLVIPPPPVNDSEPVSQ
jgi:lipopolysaccharide export system protein LptA